MEAVVAAPAHAPAEQNRGRVHARLPALAAKRAKTCERALHAACQAAAWGVRGGYPPRVRLQGRGRGT